MSCRHTERLISKSVDGRLSEHEAGAVAAHLELCPACRRFREELGAITSSARALPPRGASTHLERRVSEHWLTERTAAGWRLRAGVPQRRLILGGAVALLLLVGFGASRVWRQHGVNNRREVVRMAGATATGDRTGTLRPHPRVVGSNRLQPRTAGRYRPHPRPLSQYWERGENPRALPDSPSPSIGRGGWGVRAAAPVQIAHQWAALSPDAWASLEAQVRNQVRVKDDFVQIPFPRLADGTDTLIVAAVESYKREAAVVDARLFRKVTLGFKATALSDLCDRLRADTGIALAAGQTVADEKVTLFCKEQPLRDVMRQLSRPFGYTWIRSGKTGGYKYELMQDLRSQLVEEELRNRDRNAALLALNEQIERYRPYLALSPDEALARSKTAKPAEKLLLEKLAGLGWGPIQMYFRLSRNDQDALRSGKDLQFNAGDVRSVIGIEVGDRPLPSDVARGVLQSLREWRIRRVDALLGVAMDPAKEPLFGLAFDPKEAPDSPPPSAVPEATALVTLQIGQSELGQFTLDGTSGLYTSRNGKHTGIFVRSSAGPCASGQSHRIQKPENARLNSRFASDPALHRLVTVRPEASCRPTRPPALSGTDASASRVTSPAEPKATMADVFEALYRATGIPIVADQYTRLYRLPEVSAQNRNLFDALNSLADAMRTRWSKDGTWLQFRSMSYYDDRLKEVPNRLLNRWAMARREHGALSLDEIVEMSQLSDAQLDGKEMAEGARECLGLKEWDLASSGTLRKELRFLAQFTPEQRQEMQNPSGLLLARMSLAQQQGYISRLRSPSPIGSMEEMAGATLRVEYTQPGGFTWRMPGAWTRRWVFPLEPGSQGRRALMPSIRERTREAALQAARRLAPQASDAVLSIMRQADPQFDHSQLVPQPDQVVATDLDLKIAYIPGTINKHWVVQFGTNGNVIDPGL